MPLAEHDDAVKAIPPDRTDQPLRISVLPWRSRCDRPIPYAHRSKAADGDVAIDTIPIANNVSWRLLPSICLGALTGNPFRAWMCRYAQPQNLTAAMPQNHISIQQAERDRRDHEQIHRCDAVGMIAKKGLPALRWWPPSPHHLLCNRGLPDIDAELKQFAMYPRCSPKRVGGTHLPNELANLRRCIRPATTRSRFPAPIGSEAGPVPADYRLRCDDFQSVQHPGSQLIKPGKHRAVNVAER